MSKIFIQCCLFITQLVNFNKSGIIANPVAKCKKIMIICKTLSYIKFHKTVSFKSKEELKYNITMKLLSSFFSNC